MSSRNSNILDRPLGRSNGILRGDQASVSQSAFALLYSELVQYHQSRVASITDLERRLESSGFGVGLRVLELLAYRSRENKREIRLMSILHFVSSTVWKSLFGKNADSLERSIESADEFMIIDYEPLTSTYVSVPSDLGQLSVDAYISGIIAGVLDGAGFPARVTAHPVNLEDGEITPSNPSGSQHNSSMHGGSSGYTNTGTGRNNNMFLPSRRDKCVFLVKFSKEVLARDAALER